MWLGHLPNPTTFVLTNPEYFSLIYASYQKLFNFYIQTNTHTQTHILHPNMHGQDFFCIEIYTFLYTTFVCLLRSLTHSLHLLRINVKNIYPEFKLGFKHFSNVGPVLTKFRIGRMAFRQLECTCLNIQNVPLL